MTDESTAVAVVDTTSREIANHAAAWSSANIELIANTVAKGTTPLEFDLFLEVCRRTGLDPLTRQIYCVVREGKNRSVTIQTGIDGYRLIAQRTHDTDGQDGPYWCGPDGIWRDVWLSKEPPVSSKVVVYRKGESRPYTGIARYDAYVQTKALWKDGPNGRYKADDIPTEFWQKMPDGQLAKCAEALALRKAFPQELSGLYTSEEMGQADNVVHVERPEANAGREAMAHTQVRSNGTVVNTQDGTITGNSSTPDWTRSLVARLKAVGKAAADLEPIIGTTVTPKALRAWAGTMENPEEILFNRATQPSPGPATEPEPVEAEFTEIQEEAPAPAPASSSLREKLGMEADAELDPDDIPFEDAAAFDPATFIPQVQSLLGSIGVGLGREVGWKDVGVAFKFAGMTVAEMKKQLVAEIQRANIDDPISFVRDSLFRSFAE